MRGGHVDHVAGDRVELSRALGTVENVDKVVVALRFEAVEIQVDDTGRAGDCPGSVLIVSRASIRGEADLRTRLAERSAQRTARVGHHALRCDHERE